MLNSVKQIYDNTMKLKLPPAKPEVYCLSASKTLVAHGPPESGYSPTADDSNSDTLFIVNPLVVEKEDSQRPTYRSNLGESPGIAGGLPL